MLVRYLRRKSPLADGIMLDFSDRGATMATWWSSPSTWRLAKKSLWI